MKSFGRKHLLNYVSRFFTTDKMVISFVGDVPRKQLEKMLEADFINCQQKTIDTPVNEYFGENQFKIKNKESNFQVHSLIGGFAPGYLDDARRGMTLLTNILGGPALNSRLNLSIREKYGYSYNIEATYSTFVDTGYWAVYFGTDKKYMRKSIDLVYKELKLLRDKKLGTQQLLASKEQLKGHLALGMDSNAGLMMGLGKSLLLFNQIDTIQEIYESIDRLTASDLLEVANTYFQEDLISELIIDIE